jgi:hypothetical protein
LIACIVVFVAPLLVPEVHLLGLLERLLTVLVLQPRSVGSPLCTSLHMCFRIDSSSWLVALNHPLIEALLNWSIAFLSVIMHRVIDWSSLVDWSSSWCSIVRSAVVECIFVLKSLDFFRSLRIDIVLEASFVVFEHS